MARARRTVLAAAAACAAVVALAAPSVASAAVSCAHTTNGIATVDVTGTEPLVSIVRSGNDIVVRDGSVTGGTEVTCAPDEPTVTTTTQIFVNDNGATNSLRLLISLQGGPLEPGTGGPPENGGVDEIELTFLAGGGTDQLEVEGSDLADEFRFGSVPGPGVCSRTSTTAARRWGATSTTSAPPTSRTSSPSVARAMTI